MFDGSVCQTDGDVCLATRQDGITACIEAPANGAGLDFRSIAFAGAECVPVTGLWIVDSDGYMYRVPSTLNGVAPYWPPTPLGLAEPLIVLVRSGKWTKLMCSELVLFTNDGGGAEWINVGEAPGVWSQRFAVLIGGDESASVENDSGEILPGILHRDVLAPNVGVRVGWVGFSDVPDGIAPSATVAYGYPIGRVFGVESASVGSLAPYARTAVAEAWQADCAGRVPGDMALCYSRRLAVEYTRDHVCLDDPAITDPSDFVQVEEIDGRLGPPMDVAADVLAMPGGEIVLMGPTDLRTGLRYRVRPAPDTAPTVTIEQAAKGLWGDDPNPWTWETDYAVQPWGDGAATFTIVEDLTAAEAPGRGVDVVLWEMTSGVTSWRDATIRYFGTLGETTGGLTPIAFVGGTAVVASTASIRRLTVIGEHVKARYGWTAEIDGEETALSPLAPYTGEPDGPLYSVAVEMPGGPTGTTKRHLYRFSFDNLADERPWDYVPGDGGNNGAVYDRMCKRIATYDSTEGGATPGTDPVTVYDEETDLTLAGTRPPSPLIGPLGGVSVEAPFPRHLTQPTEY